MAIPPPLPLTMPQAKGCDDYVIILTAEGWNVAPKAVTAVTIAQRFNKFPRCRGAALERSSCGESSPLAENGI